MTIVWFRYCETPSSKHGVCFKSLRKAVGISEQNLLWKCENMAFGCKMCDWNKVGLKLLMFRRNLGLHIDKGETLWLSARCLMYNFHSVPRFPFFGELKRIFLSAFIGYSKMCGLKACEKLGKTSEKCTLLSPVSSSQVIWISCIEFRPIGFGTNAKAAAG